MKFRKKPVVIEAVQWTGSNNIAIKCLMSKKKSRSTLYHFANDKVIIQTLEGEMVASPNDWVIVGVKGEAYPCKPDIFAATYDPVPD